MRKNMIFNQTWHQKAQKGEPRTEKGAKSEPKASQREPKGAKREPKGSQKGAKGRPKCIPKSMFEKGREKGAKMVDRKY